jgi:hypothetical protein
MRGRESWHRFRFAYLEGDPTNQKLTQTSTPPISEYPNRDIYDILWQNLSLSLIQRDSALVSTLYMWRRLSGSIDSTVLDQTLPLSSVPVAKRMSWAAHRQTDHKRGRQRLLFAWLFDVNMLLLYGEGQKAFVRLQEEIIKSVCDLSIFAWQATPSQNKEHIFRYSGILAESPKVFEGSERITKMRKSSFHIDFSVTNRGIRMHTSLIVLPIAHSQGWLYVQDLDCCAEDNQCSLAICVRKCGANLSAIVQLRLQLSHWDGITSPSIEPSTSIQSFPKARNFFETNWPCEKMLLS